MNARISALILFAILLAACTNTATPVAATQPASPIPSDTPEIQPTAIQPTVETATQPPSTAVPTLAPMTDFMKIIGLWRINQWQQPQTDLAMAYVKQFGANWVGFGETPCKAISQNGSVAIDCSDVQYTAADSEDKMLIRSAHANGLRVEFFAPMFFDNGTDNVLFGANFSQAEWDSFLSGYHQILLHYAQLAEDENVDLFVIGQEYNLIAEKNDWWPGMIADIRKVYHGPITFGAKPESLEKITWWGSVDYIGCDCGQGFDNNYTADQIAAYSAKTYVAQLERLTAKYGKKAILTEMSYFAIRNAYVTGIVPARVDAQYQANLWEGMFRANNGKPWLAGWYAGPVMSSPQFGGPWDLDYSVVGKPAGDVIAHWYGGTAPAFAMAPSGTEASSQWIYHGGSDDAAFPIPFYGSVRKLDYVQDPEMGTVIQVTGTDMDGVAFQPKGVFDPHADYIEFEIRILSGNEPYLRFSAEEWDDVKMPSTVSVRSYADDPANFYNGNWHAVRIPVSSFVYAQYGLRLPVLYFAWPGDENATMQIANVRLVTLVK